MEADSRKDEREHSWIQNPDFWCPALLLLTGILFFFDPLFSSKNFYFRDILNFHYPLRRVLIDSYARGEFPLWNPYVHLGQPMLANPNYMAFYPTNLFHLVFPFNYAFKLHFIIHPLLGGVGIYFLQRRLGILALAAFGGSLVYQFSGTVLSFLNLYNIVPAVAWMPWMAWAFVGALKGGWWRRSLLFGAILGLQAIALEPLTFQCSALLCVGLATWRLLESGDRLKEFGKIIRIWLVAGIFGLILASVQILPTLELIPRSARGVGYDFSSVGLWSMHPADWVNILVPDLFGNMYTIDWATYWGESFHDRKGAYLVSYFLGSGTILLSALSFISPQKKLQRTLAALTGISIFLALGEYNPLYRWLYGHVPGFNLGRYPCKYFLLGTLTLAIQASLGLQEILKVEEGRWDRQRQLKAVALIGVVLAALLLSVWLYCQSYPADSVAWLRSKVDPARVETKDFLSIKTHVAESFRASGIFLLLSSVLLFFSSRLRRAKFFTSIFIILLGSELVPANLRLAPLISDPDLLFTPQVNLFLQRIGPKEPSRVFSRTFLDPIPGTRIIAPNRSYAWTTVFNRMSGQPMYGIMNRIQYSLDNSIDGLTIREANDLWEAWLVLMEPMKLALLGRLNTPWILSLDEIRDPRVRLVASFETNSNWRLRLYQLDNTLPRAFFAPGIRLVSSHVDALYNLLRPEFPGGNTVILEGSQSVPEIMQEGAGAVSVLDYQNNYVLCEVEAKSAGYLVLLDSYYPGWRAYLDGNETTILKANYAFRAVPVPPGKHQVAFRYKPQSFYVGLAGTSFALLFGLANIFWQLARGA